MVTQVRLAIRFVVGLHGRYPKTIESIRERP